MKTENPTISKEQLIWETKLQNQEIKKKKSDCKIILDRNINSIVNLDLDYDMDLEVRFSTNTTIKTKKKGVEFFFFLNAWFH